MKYGNNQIDNNIPFKLNLISHLKSKYFLKVNKLKEDPLSKLVINYPELEIYLKLDNSIIFKNLYLNIKNIINILYDSDQIIEIDKQYYNNQSLSQYFYLVMLINQNKNIINFSYSFNFIREMNNNNKNNNKQLEKIIKSKIILELINNYIGIDINEKTDDKEIEMIQNENKSIIEQNLTIFNDIGLNYNKIQIEDIEIDDLYVDIIYSLISNKSIDNYKYILDLFYQMNLIQIDISKKIYTKLLNTSFFNSNHINKFIILNLKDLSDDKKIYFYYILLNLILKDSIYIYQIPFLIKFRIFILDNLKSNLDNLFTYIPKKRLDKFSFIIEKLSDCAYYKKKFNNYKEKQLNSNKSNNNNNNNNYISFKINNNRFDNFYQKIKTKTIHTNSICNYSNTNTININTQTIKREKNNNENNNENYNVNNIENIYENNNNYNENNIENIYENNNENNNENNYDIKSKESFILKTEPKINKTIEIKDYKNEIIKKSDNNYNSFSTFFNIIFYNDDLLIEEKDEIKFIESFLTNINCYEDTIFQNSNKKFFKIMDNISVETYNSFINGEDKLILKKSDTKEEIITIKGYSFPLGINCFGIMHNRILICPCKKFVNGQKNGIYLFNFQNKEFPYYFEDTKNFKVNCICPLYDKYNKKTDFFLVAGLNKKVVIKLYKLIYDYNYRSIKIKFIENIIIRKNEYFTEFKKSIKYLKQSRLTGNIIIYSNKIIYIFSPPNLEKYLLFEEYEHCNYFYDIGYIEESTLYNNIP